MESRNVHTLNPEAMLSLKEGRVGLPVCEGRVHTLRGPPGTFGPGPIFPAGIESASGTEAQWKKVDAKG